MLHPGEAASLADRFIERILRCIGSEHLAIAGAEAFDGFVVEKRFGCREQEMLLQCPGRHLRRRVEKAQAFQFVAEEVEPQTLV